LDFDLTDEQRMLQEAARDFVRRECPPERAKQLDERGTGASELIAKMRELGWFSLGFPESEGGAGGGPVELCILAEELGHASFDVAMLYVVTLLTGQTAFRWANVEQKQWLRDHVFSGKRRLSVSISEPESGSDAASLSTRAELVGDHFVVNGTKAWCTGAGQPNTTLAMYVRTSTGGRKHDGLSLLLIDAETPGVEIRKTPTLARNILGTNEVFLTNAQVPRSRLYGPLDGGWRVLLSNLELERVLISGAYVGVAQATLDDALEYSKTRKQFGREIGTFQAIAHPLADMQTEIDGARLLALRAAWLLEKGRPVRREGAMAKLKGSETYVAMARLGMQVMGGHGYATESVMSYRWRESIVATISGGTSQIQRNGIAGSMGLRCY
jgi:alkylation response protein AidB-like acyl-CoA dehydrogenase